MIYTLLSSCRPRMEKDGEMSVRRDRNAASQSETTVRLQSLLLSTSASEISPTVDPTISPTIRRIGDEGDESVVVDPSLRGAGSSRHRASRSEGERRKNSATEAAQRGQLCAANATEAPDETWSAHSLFDLANIASPRGRSIRREGKRADAAARNPPTYCFGQRARDHCRKTCGERGDHRRGDRFEARRRRIGPAHSSPGQNAD